MLSLAQASVSFAGNPMPAARASIMMSASDYAKTMPGSGPFGYFDPLGMLSQDGMSAGSARYYREVELKHGRVAMLAAVGFVVGEAFHPLFGGDIDVPSFVAFQATPLQAFWPSVVGIIGCFEFFSLAQFEPGRGFEIKDTFASGEKREPGDYMFDPLNLKPTDPAALKVMQEKEINNGRLAMMAIAGMVVQETFVTQTTLF